jgi:hypothetical protein
MLIDEQLRAFLATIHGEAAGCAPATWKAIASVIMNRVGVLEWRKLKTPLAVIAGSGFDAYTQENALFKLAFKVLGDPHLIEPNSPIARLQLAVEPIFRKEAPPTTDALLYYSPKAQAALHKAKPGLYRDLPRWDFGKLMAVTIPGTEADDFAWFKYGPAIA